MNIKANEAKVFHRILDDNTYLRSLGYNVLGIFLQGSQNYNLDYENSDIDTKAIVIPKFNDFCLNKKPTSTTIVLENNEHIDVKDIRLMFDCFRKQNINFLEILFTEYAYINDDYTELFQPMLDNREKIAHYNNYAAINCLVGMVLEKHKAMEHPYPNLIDKIEKYGYDPKQLHHILRCTEFLKRYINGVSYADCLISTDPQYLIDVKSKCIYNLEEARKIANDKEILVKDIKDRYMKNHEVMIDHEVEIIMDNVILNIMKQSFRNELKGYKYD